MRRLEFLVVTGLFGFVLIATAVSTPADDRLHIAPAPTSVDRPPFCGAPDAAPAVAVAPGGTAVSFTLVAPGCE